MSASKEVAKTNLAVGRNNDKSIKMKCKSTTFALVINIPTDAKIDEFDIKFKECLKELEIKHNCDYYAIKHDKDIKEDGTAKIVHYHLITKNDNNIKLTVKTWLEIVSKLFNLDISLISIESIDNKLLVSYIQYLVHLNDAKKTQYQLNDVITNRPLNVRTAINRTNKDRDFIRNNKVDLLNDVLLQDMCLKLNKLTLLSKIGSKAYKEHKMFIDAIYNEKMFFNNQIRNSKDAYYINNQDCLKDLF